MTGRPPRVLLYHEVDSRPQALLAHYTITHNPLVFERHMRWLHESFGPIGGDELREGLAQGLDLSERVLVTFDDGYRAAALSAGDVLGRLRIPSLWFVNTGYWHNDRLFWLSELMWLRGQGLLAEAVRLARGRWPGIVGPLPPAATPAEIDCWAKEWYSPTFADFVQELAAGYGLDAKAEATAASLFATPDKLRALAPLAEIGNHTHSHPNLRNLSLSELRDEVLACHEALASELGAIPNAFAFPFGEPGAHWSPAHPELVRGLGYQAIYSVATPEHAAESGLWAGVIPRHPVPPELVDRSEFRAFVEAIRP
jgi:peptidoglycan/xylan/chitin deacetylase (PgdA/CDA1 family)